MATLNPDHLLQQAERLLSPPSAGPRRQVDLRRAVSSAYYALFHFCLTEVADEFIGVTQRSASRYALVYRSIDHRSLKDLSVEAKRPTPSSRYAPYLPLGGFEPNIQAFSTAVIELQGWRHQADYNPQPSFSSADARLAIVTARSAIGRFQSAQEDHRKAFLTLLICPPR